MMLDGTRELSLRDRVLALRSLDSFSSLEESTLLLLAEHSRLRTFNSGAYLLEGGQLPRSIFIVLEGGVDVQRNQLPVALVERGRPVGILSVLARDEQGVDAKAVMTTATIEIPTTAFLGAMESDFSIVRNALRLSAGAVVRSRGSMPVAPEDAEPAEPGPVFERSLTMTERIIQLRQGPIFSQCNLDAVVELVRRSREVRFEAGEEIWSLGAASGFSLGIDYGVATCSAEDGRSVEVGHGFALGVMDSFAAQPRSYGVVAKTPMVGFRIDFDAFMSVLETHFELAIQLLGALSSTLLEGN